MRTAINIAIIAVLAALVVLVPGGGTGASVAGQAVSIVFLGALVWFATLQYREHRIAIFSLGGRNRALLYGALGVLTVTIIASDRLTSTGAGLVAWFVLLGVCAYVVLSVVLAARRL